MRFNATHICVGLVLMVMQAGVSPLSAAAGEPRMSVVKGRDVSGDVLKRLGLPNQDYCWQQCLQEARCTGTRWGAIEGTTPGQCQLLTGELRFHELRDIRTQDGKRIQVTVSRKQAGS